MRARKPATCRRARSTPPPMTPRCAGWRSGRRAIRRPLRHCAGNLERGERRRRIFPRHRRRRASVRRRGEITRRSFFPAAKASACRRGLPSLSRPARPGRWRAFTPRPLFVLPSGQESEALAPLPIEALRLSPETCATLRRLGFKSVGALLDKPRAPFAARFPAELLRRLDQALGRIDEPLVPDRRAAGLSHAALSARTDLHAGSHRRAGEPSHADACARADPRRCRSARVAAVALSRRWRGQDGRYRADAADTQCRSCGAADRAEARSAGGDGRCRLRLRSHRACRHPRRNHAGATKRSDRATTAATADKMARCAILVDTLRQRLGSQSVRRFEPVASHIPERAEVSLPVAREASAPWPEPEQTRPLLLLPHAEPAEEVMASSPTVRRGVFAGAG